MPKLQELLETKFSGQEMMFLYKVWLNCEELMREGNYIHSIFRN